MTRRRVLLLNPPGSGLPIRDLYCSISSKGNYYWPAIDLLAVSGRLKDDFEVSVIDAVALGIDAEATLQRVLPLAPEAVISMTGSATWPQDLPLLERIKRACGARIILSGDVCLDPEAWILKENPFVDALLTDFTTPHISSFLKGRLPDDAQGLTLRAGGQVRALSPAREGTFSIPTPAHGLFPLGNYRLPHIARYPFSTVLTSFGCPFPCDFCIQARGVMGFRLRDVSDFAMELDHLGALGVRELYFRDPLFTARRQHTLDICRAIREASASFTWSANCRVDAIDEDLLIAMKRSGCHHLAFGLESASERTLAAYKKAPLAAARKTIALCKKHSIHVAGYFILGLPGEDENDVRETIRFAVESGIDEASFSLPSPDFATPMRRRLGETSRWFDRSRAFGSVNPNIPADRMASLLALAHREFYLRPSTAWKHLIRIRNARQLKEVLMSGISVIKRCAVPTRKEKPSSRPPRIRANS